MPQTDEILENGAIVLFDGVCHFCQGTVQFIIRRDPEAYFHFAPLQSQLAVDLLTRRGLEPGGLQSLVLVERARTSIQSTAVLRILGQLTGPWQALTRLTVIPALLRDPFYNFFARHRYRWFGRGEVCPVPTPEIRRRFLE